MEIVFCFTNQTMILQFNSASTSIFIMQPIPLFAKN